MARSNKERKRTAQGLQTFFSGRHFKFTKAGKETDDVKINLKWPKTWNTPGPWNFKPRSWGLRFRGSYKQY